METGQEKHKLPSMLIYGQEMIKSRVFHAGDTTKDNTMQDIIERLVETQNCGLMNSMSINSARLVTITSTGILSITELDWKDVLVNPGLNI